MAAIQHRAAVPSRVFRQLILLTIAGIAAPAMALDGTSAANVTAAQDKEFWYVGRTQFDISAPNTHIGTGSYFAGGLAYDGRGAVLTVSHAINLTKKNGFDQFTQQFERFQLGNDTTPLPALGVQNPGFVVTGLSSSDVGLLLLLNAPTPDVTQTFPTLARPRAGGAGPDVLPAGASVEFLGFTVPGDPTASTKRRGLMALPNPAGATITNDIYTFNKPPSPDFGQPGDSGGPEIFDFGGGGGGKKIVSVTRSASNPPGTITDGVRIDNHNAFLAGDGVSNQRVIDRWKDGVNTTWSTNNRWERSSALTGAKPQLRDVVVLDPTTGSDKTRVVTIDENTEQLDGLLNDVTLQVTEKTLSVIQSSGATPGSGVLNGGIINVGGGGVGTAGTFDSGYSIDNVGTINVMERGTVSSGLLLIQTLILRQRGLLNNATATINVTGGKFSSSDFQNNGTIAVTSGGTFSASFSFGFNAGTIAATNNAQMNMVKLTNIGTVLASRTAVTETGARIDVSQDCMSAGTITADAGTFSCGSMTNDGTVTITSAGKLFAFGGITNNKLMSLSGAGTISAGGLTNSGTFTVNKADAFCGTFVTNTGTITVGGGAGATEKGYFSAKYLTNDGTLKLDSGGTINVVAKLGRNAWKSDPATTIVHQDLALSETGYYQGIGAGNEVIVGGNYRNYSQQNTQFDNTTSEIRFVDPETLNDLDNIQDPSVDPLILTPAPQDFHSRDVSYMFWPSLKLPSTPGNAPTAPGAATLYLRSLQLIAGPEDDPSQSDPISIFDDPTALRPRETTLDVHGGVIYLIDPLGALPPDTLIFDSLDPGRSLSDMIRPLSFLPPDDFAIDSLVVDGSDYLVLALPEPSLLSAACLLMLAGLRRRRAG